MSVKFSSIQHLARLAFAIGSVAGHYEDEHSAQNHPHQLQEALTPQAAEFVRRYASIRIRWNQFNDNRKKVIQELKVSLGSVPSEDSVKERFLSDPVLSEQWKKHEKELTIFRRWGGEFTLLCGSEFDSQSLMDESIERFAKHYFDDVVIPNARKRITDWFFDDRLDVSETPDVPDFVPVPPSVVYLGDVSIEDRLSLLRAVNFDAPSTIDFEGLASQGAFVFENGNFDVLSEGWFEENEDGTSICHLSEDAFKEAAYFEHKLALAYGEIFLWENVTKPRLSLEMQLSSLRDRLLTEIDDSKLANIRAQIKEVERRLYGGIQ